MNVLKNKIAKYLVFCLVVYGYILGLGKEGLMENSHKDMNINNVLVCVFVHVLIHKVNLKLMCAKKHFL